MEYAVVKFMNETDSDNEIVSEVPSSWLTKDQTFCKWPPEKYAAIYIAKKTHPQDDWNEYPVEVEQFCGSLAEAKERAKGKLGGDVGRGYRIPKPTDYFSPAEEEEKNKGKKRVISKKDSFDGLLPFMHIVENDVQICNNELNTERNENEAIQVSSASVIDKGDHLQMTIEGTMARTGDDTNKEYQTAVDSGTVSEGSLASLLLDNDVRSINTKLDKILRLLADFKIDMEDLKERITENVKNTREEKIQLSKPLPLQKLPEIEELDKQLEHVEDERKVFVRVLKSIGGNDAKDFTYRILKTVFTDTVAEMCSWTGRKNNFEVGHLTIFKIMFRVVNQKTLCTQKDFEGYVAEWLRHAKQRKERNKKTPN